MTPAPRDALLEAFKQNEPHRCAPYTPDSDEAGDATASRHGSAQGRVRGRAWIYFDVILAPLLVVAGSLTIAADFYLGLLLAFEVYGWRCLWGVAAVCGMFAYLVCEGRRAK